MRRGSLLDAPAQRLTCRRPPADAPGQRQRAADRPDAVVPHITDQALDLNIRLRIPLLLHQLSQVPELPLAEQRWMALSARTLAAFNSATAGAPYPYAEDVPQALLRRWGASLEDTLERQVRVSSRRTRGWTRD